jgi:hypothetical protein
LHSITARFYLRPSHFVISLSFSNICHVTSRKLRLPQCIMGDDLHIKRKKAVGRQRNLGLAKNKIWYQIISKFINLALARATRAAATLVFCCFYPKPLYKSPHQSFFYSFITILPSESGVALHYCTILPRPLVFLHTLG